MKVDLDAIQARREAAEPARHRLAVVAEELLDDVDALLAELRAAREVVEAARRQGGSGAYQATVWAAVVAYDEAVAS